MYSHAPENYVCPFCLLVRGIENETVYSIQNDIVYRDQSVTAFIGSHQWPRHHGNIIIVPNEHFENIFDLPERYALDIQRAARLVSLAMKSVYGCDGISLRQHNEPAGYQDVWHYHLHVTPRYTDDQFYPSYGERAFMQPEERAGHAYGLREALTQLV
jgi:histidine triad (HIT) family protein